MEMGIKMTENIIDMTETLQKFYKDDTIIKAEAIGKNVLILRKDKIKVLNKKTYAYNVEYRWLSVDISDPEAFVCILGREHIGCLGKEAKQAIQGKSLFDIFQLF